MANHDKGYKLLHSHASVVADLLRGFVKDDWVQEHLGQPGMHRGSKLIDEIRVGHQPGS